jgi:hypothetical protein
MWTARERLLRFRLKEDDDRHVLPPRLHPCTPDQIRKYIASPPDFAKLKASEQLPDQSMSDEDRLLIQQEIAKNNAEDSAARLAALEMARGSGWTQPVQAATQQQTSAQPPATPPPSPPQSDQRKPPHRPAFSSPSPSLFPLTECIDKLSHGN